MSSLIYALCASAAAACAYLLLNAYRSGGNRLLLWSGLCFVGLTINNVLLVADKVLVGEHIDLSIWRTLVALIAMTVLIYGLIRESE